jgi:hypothetical protein
VATEIIAHQHHQNHYFGDLALSEQFVFSLIIILREGHIKPGKMPSQPTPKQLTTYVGSSPSSYLTFYGKQRVHLCKEESKAGVIMAFKCFPQTHTKECKWRLDILEPEFDVKLNFHCGFPIYNLFPNCQAQDAIYVETGQHDHRLQLTEYNIAVAKKEAFRCVQEDTSTHVDQILLDLCKKNR